MSKNVLERWHGVFGGDKKENMPPDAPKDDAVQEKGLMTRRKMLQVLGVQVFAGAVAVNALAAPKNFNPKHYNREITPDQLPNTRAWLVTNPAQCVGCRTCEIVCSLSHEGQCQPSLSRITTTYDPTQSLSRLAVMANVCRQCNMADCYLACAYDALSLDKETGARVIDSKKCTGCGECFAACPWDMIVKNEEADVFSKCDLCGGDPQCVKYCPADAISFVDLR
ncbi:4Fe-4S dicluster domain-containing protein [Desulfolutivibrio sulfoxidireducens]|uniref:4Fe-4S dicluster domain-containing protein n=1 Tax=Desulfolutivibrio sulfoxidireducens TaxID=2773299 RepID=UPI00210E99F6|nr:4Fe-4S dicluster domain-containing protein [Desulfolutivibrio sulfoxidireducens]